ncbi:glycoside hydrolase family 2 protein [Fibrivirga algicola]|nr:DUF4982 domain-containing protein [Fibrivirga algicola]
MTFRNQPGSWVILLLFWSIALRVMAAPPTSPRVKYNANANWKVFVGDPAGAEASAFDDASWKTVTLPWAWNEDEAFRKDIHDLSTGIAWYRKHVSLPATDAGKTVFLEFEGVRQGGEVYVNGQFVGRHENGAMAFGFNITKLLKPAPQQNVVAVRTDNAWDYREKATNQTYQWNNKNFNANYGGISKNVYLHVTEPIYQTLPLFSTLGTTGVYIAAQEFDIPGKKATITAESQVKNESVAAQTFTYEVTVEELNGKLVKTFTGEKMTLQPGETNVVRASSRLDGLHFWSWGFGYLYNVYTTLRVNGKATDVVHTRTGFRKTEFGNGMVKLNDRVIQFKGYAQRTSNEWPAVGMSLPAWLSDYSNRLMTESNANLVRWMHITPWKQDVESCDRVGLMQAMPAGDAESDVTGRRWEQRKELMRDAIVYNRNNPSIIFYESGNESIREEHMQEMLALRRQYDPNGGRAIGSREMLDSHVAEYGGEMLYINKSAKHPMWAMEYSRDEGLRKYWDEFSPPYHKDGDGPLYNKADASVYNRNQDTHAREDVIRWFDYWQERPGTGKRVNSGGVNIIFSDSNTHFRGAENYRRSGEVDALRVTKDGFYAHQVMWDGWVDTERSRTHLMGHWNYKAGVTKPVFVVSNGDKVELFVNGKSLGFGRQSHRFLFTFDAVSWQSGTIRAVSYDAAGKQVSESMHKTAGEPVALKLTAITHPGGIQATGADLVLVQVEVVDAAGNRCPTALNMIDFSLNGPAEWRGGLAQGPDNYILARSLPVEGGVNRILIRPTTQAGVITVNALSAGLKAASLTLTSKPVPVQNGLTWLLPGSDLPVNVSRGPTPVGPSFIASRTTVAIVKATAGANQDKAAMTYDDNELSDWKSDGKLASAWIEYELERPAAVSELAVKFTNWRSSKLPIRISVDGQEAYRDTTQGNLGYYTMTFPARTGKVVRLELIGASTSRDAFGIVEITGQKDPAAGQNERTATLGIVEAEIYEKPVPARSAQRTSGVGTRMK